MRDAVRVERGAPAVRQLPQWSFGGSVERGLRDPAVRRLVP
jgi:hypothetical protein